MVDTESSQAPDRILVVEDEDDIRRALEKCLRRLGYEVVTAENGELGLSLAIELRPQVILTDIRMPQMDGHTFLRRLAPHELDSAIVVMSAHGDMSDVIDVLRHGAVDYLKKPWAPSELVAAIGRAVDIHHQRRLARAARSVVGGAAPEPPAAASETTVKTLPEPPGAEPVVDELLQQLRSGAITLPTFPAILSELRILVAKPDAAMHEIIALVERDPKLAAQVLRVAGTPQNARGGRVNDIRAAVSRIGLRQLQGLIQTVIGRDSRPARDATLRRMQARIWRYSIARAVSMRGLAELAGPAAQLEPETAYLAGLLADSGAGLLLWMIGEQGATTGSPRAASSPALAVGLVCDQHQDVGAALLASWELDPVVTMIAQTHHLEAPPAPPSGYWNLAILGTAMADSLTARDDPTRSRQPSPDLVDRCGAELRIGTSAASKIEASVRREFDGIMSALA